MSDEQGRLRSDPDQAIAGLCDGIERARRLARETDEALREIQLNMATRVDFQDMHVVDGQATSR